MIHFLISSSDMYGMVMLLPVGNAMFVVIFIVGNNASFGVPCFIDRLYDVYVSRSIRGMDCLHMINDHCYLDAC